MSQLADAEMEFGGAELGDARRSARAIKLAAAIANDPSASFPDLLSPGELEAAYRFFKNEAITAEAVLEPHVQQTLRRMGGEETTLVVHDSSTMSFGSEGYREGLSSSTGGHQ